MIGVLVEFSSECDAFSLLLISFMDFSPAMKFLTLFVWNFKTICNFFFLVSYIVAVLW